MSSKRRDFLRNTLLTGIGATLSPLATSGHSVGVTSSHPDTDSDIHPPQSGTLTLLQTTDVHCQIHPHDEMFWENGEMVFRKTAGYAQLATILDALDWRVDTDIVLSNGFRFCPPRNLGPDGRAAITEGYIFDMLPVDSAIRTAKVTGQQLLDWLEKELNNVFAKDASKRFGGWVVKFKGMEVEFLAFGEQGKRVKKVTVGSQPLDLQRTYTVAACERDGDSETMLCRIPNVREGKNTPYTLHQTMRDYLAANSPVTPTPHGAAKALDAPATLLTQVTGVHYEFR
jgi:2',3'-cyclic-nucleotide 2'-phosphodiesterase (5'-nucleotidase family)